MKEVVIKEIVKYSLTCTRIETDNPDLKKFLTRLIGEKQFFFLGFNGAWSERGLPEGTGYLLLGENIFDGSPIVDLETFSLSVDIIQHRIDTLRTSVILLKKPLIGSKNNKSNNSNTSLT